MNLEKKENNSMIIKYQNTDNVLKDVCSIIESARNYAGSLTVLNPKNL